MNPKYNSLHCTQIPQYSQCINKFDVISSFFVRMQIIFFYHCLKISHCWKRSTICQELSVKNCIFRCKKICLIRILADWQRFLPIWFYTILPFLMKYLRFHTQVIILRFTSVANFVIFCTWIIRLITYDYFFIHIFCKCKNVWI